MARSMWQPRHKKIGREREGGRYRERGRPGEGEEREGEREREGGRMGERGRERERPGDGEEREGVGGREREGGERGSSTSGGLPRRSSSCGVVCHKSGEQFGKWAAAEAHHLSRHASLCLYVSTLLLGAG